VISRFYYRGLLYFYLTRGPGLIEKEVLRGKEKKRIRHRAQES